MAPMGMKGGGGDNDNDDVQAAASAAACLVLRATPVVAVAVVIVRWVLWLWELEHLGVKSAGFMSVFGQFSIRFFHFLLPHSVYFSCIRHVLFILVLVGSAPILTCSCLMCVEVLRYAYSADSFF